MLTPYWPGSSRAAGKLKRPSLSLATVTVMVVPAFFTLTSTPSIAPSSAEVTWPVRAGACAYSVVDAVEAKSSVRLAAMTSERLGRRMKSSWINRFPKGYAPCRGPATRLRAMQTSVGYQRDWCQQTKAVSHVQHLFVREFGPLLDELEARLGLGAHQPLDRFFGVLAVVGDQHDAQERALARVHGGLLELARHHLAEALETADLHLGVGVEFSSEQFGL